MVVPAASSMVFPRTGKANPNPDHADERMKDKQEGSAMNALHDKLKSTQGKIGYIILWLLGIPIPILFAIFLLRGCN